jgi:hypothetical protein
MTHHKSSSPLGPKLFAVLQKIMQFGGKNATENLLNISFGVFMATSIYFPK